MSRAALRRPGVIAVFGGTFDPPHWGHVRAAEAVRDRMGVDEVWLVPASVPPHRKEAPRLTARERLALVQEAVAGRERLLASPIELEREGPSYTLDTLDQIAASRPVPPDGGASLVFVVGTDAFREIRSWHRYEELLERHPVVVHRRAGVSLHDALSVLPERFLPSLTDDLAAPLNPPRIFRMDITLPDTKAHRIREDLSAGHEVRELVPRTVASRIERRGHYR